MEDVRVTGESVDPLFETPYIEVNELRNAPVPHRDGSIEHRYVRGGFRGTDAQFVFYFPPKERYQGRFHHGTYPLSPTADVNLSGIDFSAPTADPGFSLENGAYYVQASDGGDWARKLGDLSVSAYRINAASAKYSRLLAAQLYGPHRPFGYIFGASGGAFQTAGCSEHTRGVWDGFIPYTLGSNNAAPGFLTVAAHAQRMLMRRNKVAAVLNALSPGGGDVYAGLDDEERIALQEATRLGFPIRGWDSFENEPDSVYQTFQAIFPPLDPTYKDDFWTKPGYEGADPTSSIQAERMQFETTIVRVISAGATRFGQESKQAELASIPDWPIVGTHLVVLSGDAVGDSLVISKVEGRTVSFADLFAGAPATNTKPNVLSAIQAGDKVRIDNSWPLAMEYYHRHQVPGPDEYGWNQYRDASGKPIYAQRQRLMSETFTASSAGSLLSGRINGKMLLLQGLLDYNTFPWCADWYRTKVKQAIGPAFDDSFALWFIDYVRHSNNPATRTPFDYAHTIVIKGALQQGLQDLARWVEKGIKPPQTNYRVADSQVEVPASAAERGGVQPVVDLRANGGLRAEVATGQPVILTATIEAPHGAGKIVKTEWDFEGGGTYPVSERPTPQERLTLTATHVYSAPGTYFPVLRAGLHRTGDANTPYAVVQNLGRARVVVS